MYRLYGSPGSGSAAIEATLAECGADYEVIVTRTAEKMHLTEAYKAINPRQQVPALQLPDGSFMTEGAAMMLHLVDAFPKAGLAPAPGSSARAQHDRWIVFMAVNIYEGELRRAYSERYADDAASVKKKAAAYVERHYEIIEEAVVGPFLFGDAMTTADIYLWNMATWMDPNWLSEHCPRVHALMTVIGDRPLVAPIAEAHSG